MGHWENMVKAQGSEFIHQKSIQTTKKNKAITGYKYKVNLSFSAIIHNASLTFTVGLLYTPITFDLIWPSNIKKGIKLISLLFEYTSVIWIWLKLALFLHILIPWNKYLIQYIVSLLEAILEQNPQNYGNLE